MSGILNMLVGGGPTLQVVAPDINAVVAVGATASGSSSAVVTGGSGSYSYAWSASITGVTFGGTATATLSATKPVTSVGARSGSAIVTVTDLASGATAQDTISIYLENA